MIDPAIDPEKRRAYFVELINLIPRIYSYDLDSFALVGSRRITGPLHHSGGTIVKTPAGLALRLPTQIVLIKDLASL